ncbi:hypothetical protein HPB52_012060 [Rhipicephalus sanguineus]|uniref:Helicase C-terminal domain-containing protein n=1 Tax=Rhipicephalus sanguineus TaxID=34632 RepID=A0A9D4T3V9_RHISA|nr:hypothetical protein HPB52_012060 [Rhipicephalus sanguineus]
MLEHCNGQPATGDTETDVADPTDPLKDCHNTWVLGIDYFRIDGATSVDLRSRWISMFNDENNHRGRLFLVSTRAGSLGTNLVGANRVVLMDASWNPTHDTQAIFRVYRFGQKKPVFIYRLLAQGTMEEKIYNRQVTKLALACRVVDKRHVGRLFNAAELVDLYTFNPDRLLAELLIRNKDWIVSYHEHDSLLQNVKTEELTEEEHKLAWEEYKNEREGRIVALQTSKKKLSRHQYQWYRKLSRHQRKWYKKLNRHQCRWYWRLFPFINAQLPIPDEIHVKLKEAALAIDQLNIALRELDEVAKVWIVMYV